MQVPGVFQRDAAPLPAGRPLLQGRGGARGQGGLPWGQGAPHSPGGDPDTPGGAMPWEGQGGAPWGDPRRILPPPPPPYLWGGRGERGEEGDPVVLGGLHGRHRLAGGE